MTCHRLALLALGTIFLLSSVAACDRNTEKFVAGEKPRAPDLARIFPEEDPSARRAGEQPQMPSAPGRAAPPMAGQMPPPAGGAPGGGGGNISGTITVAPAVAGSLPAGATLFVIARPAGVTSGPPLAVLRIPSPHFPLPFEIGPANVMIPSMRFQGDIEISARLDADGNAMTRDPSDVSGASAEPHQPGATGVSVVLGQTGTGAPRPAGGAGSMAGEMPPPAGAASAAAGGNISGTITVAPALAGSLPAGAMLFVIARPVGVTGGPPLAVLRIPSPHFPLPFEIGPANVMIPSMRFQGDIEISARLDADGNAMTRSPGDVSGATREPHRPGATGVSIVLDQKT